MDTPSLQALLDTNPWDAAFDDRTLGRGGAYYQDGRITSLRHESSASIDTLLGVVRGSRKKPYACVIELSAGMRIKSRCTCPMGANCKHVVAVLLMATDTPWEFWPGTGEAADPWASASTPSTHDPLREWTHWLHTVDCSQAPRSPFVAATERQFGVLLRGTNDDSPRLLVNPAWLRPSRSKAGPAKSGGALVDPQSLVLDAVHGPVPTPVGGWPPDVMSALAVLLQEPRPHVAAQNWTAIHADHQEQALQCLLAHYPAYHERGSNPLTRGADQPLQLHWQDHLDGAQRIVPGIAGDTPTLLLRGRRLWYVQAREQRYGLVQADAQWVDALMQIPVAQPEQVAALRARLQHSSVAALLPPPTERGAVQTIDSPPVPVLQLRVVMAHTGHHGAPIALGCARLAFDYGPIRVLPEGYETTLRRLHEGQVFAVRRQLDAEHAVQAPLRRAGLVGIGWYPEGRGIPARLVERDDLVLLGKPRQQPQAASAWQGAIAELRAAGFRLEYSDDFPHQRHAEIDAWHADITPAGNQWFDVSLGIDVEGQRVDLLPLLRRMLSDPAFPLVAPKREKNDATWRVPLDATRSVEIPLSRLRPLIEPLLEWLQGDGELRVHRTRAEALANMATAAQLHWRGGDILRAQLELLRHASRDAKPPRGFKATLRPYQRAGLAWLNFLGDAGLGGILADDMGLGKTVQVLAHLLNEKRRGRLQHPALVVAPTSLVGNWRDETARFAPGLKVLVLHGPQRADAYHQIDQHDLVITTYPLLPRDEDRLHAAQFSLLVLDEAQAIKNPRSQAAKVVRTIPAARRLAMTGTPLENHLGELWAQFDAVEPGLLGTERQFTKLYRTPIEKHADSDRQQRLNQRIGALLLRRRKQDVLTDLPAKTETIHKLELADAQRSLYETLRLAQHTRVQQAVKERGLSQSGIIVLDALLKLRQACCDPRLVKLPSARKITQSAKLDALLDLLDGLLADDRRILVFSQFTEMLALIENALLKRRITYQLLTGQTPARQRTALVKHFQSGAVPVFLISLKAGGIGLNLTAADTVIHYDPWWNPAVEAQATDRAHRIGQDKPVFVYRLICAGTVEEKIQSLQARKADLAQAVLDGGGATERLRFDEADLAELFAPL